MRQPPCESFAFAGRDDAGTIRADEPRAFAFHRALHLHHVVDRNAFGDGDDQIESGIHAFENRVGREGRRNENRGSRRAGLFHGFGDGVEDGNFSAVLKELPAFAGRDAGDDLRAVINRELRVPRAEAAGDALDENFGVGFNENGHGCRIPSTASRRVRRRSWWVSSRARLRKTSAPRHVGDRRNN